jgi:hypothetical protein
MHLEDNRDILAASYPDLTRAELDQLLFRVADAKSVQKLEADDVDAAATAEGVVTDGPSGNWICASDSAGVLRLTMQASSYSLVGRLGQTMVGEYAHVGQDLVVTNGPLKGLGLASGTLSYEPSGRVIDFQSEEPSKMRCLEVL